MKPDNSEKQDFISDNSKNEVKLYLIEPINAEKNSNKSEDQNFLENKDKIILHKLANYCQIRADIYS